MGALYHSNWNMRWNRRSLRRAVWLSLFVHVAAGAAIVRSYQRVQVEPIPISYEVQFAAPPSSAPPVEEAKAAPPPKPQPPVPDPPKEPERKPEPQKKPEPKPEPKKEPEKVAKVEKKEEPKKVEPKKEEKKPEPKPKAEKKPEPEKKTSADTEKMPAPEKLAMATPAPPSKPVSEVQSDTPQKTGVKTNQLPNILNAWGRNLQRKVEKVWAVPGGIKLDAKNSEAWVSFWVDRNGNLLGTPEIVKAAADPALGESGVQAILAAAPLPPLPIDYKEEEQQVIYVFSLVK